MLDFCRSLTSGLLLSWGEHRFLSQTATENQAYGTRFKPWQCLRSCFLCTRVSIIKVHLTCVSYSSFTTLHGHFALPCNPYFTTQTALIPSTMVRACLPLLLLNCGTLYLNILSQPHHCQLLKQHLKLAFFVTISLTTNDTLVF